VVGLVLIARGQEHALLRVLGSSALLMVLGAGAVTAAEPTSPSVWIAAFILLGLVLSVAQFAHSTVSRAPDLSRLLRVAALGAFAFAVLGAVAAAEPRARLGLAVLPALAGTAGLLALTRRVYGHRPRTA
jgi:hypothetical protein